MSLATQAQKDELIRRLELPTDHVEHISAEQLTRAFGTCGTLNLGAFRGTIRQAPTIVRAQIPVGVRLSQRQIQVLAFLAIGDQKEEIARKMGLSNPTIKTHCEHIRQKLCATTMAQAVATAIHLGLLVIENA